MGDVGGVEDDVDGDSLSMGPCVFESVPTPGKAPNGARAWAMSDETADLSAFTSLIDEVSSEWRAANPAMSERFDATAPA